MSQSSRVALRFLELIGLMRPRCQCHGGIGTDHPRDQDRKPDQGGASPSLHPSVPDLPPHGDEPWDRLQCLGCGKVIAVRQERLPQDVKGLTQKNDFQDLGHRLLVFGFCPRCQRKRQ